MTTLELLIVIAGVLHLGILIASALVPRVLDWKRELAKLAPLSRHLVWTHGAFIVVVIIGFAAVSIINASVLAGGGMLARSVCGFIALFWFARLVIQLFFFDASPYLTKAYLKVGFHGLTLVFAYFSAVYGWAAVG